MPSKKHRLVVDTNLWISLLLTKDFARFDAVLFDSNTKLLFSQELLDEFITVARRPKFRRYFNFDDLHQLITGIRNKAAFIQVVSDVKLCRDPKDNFFLSLCKDGKATHLLTGDNDLLELKKVGRTRIMTITDYLSRINHPG
jgi:putative PIN family toxin of toxin-antitoxin system